ncbi:MAG: hypothetical protein ACMUJM_09655 [bacterium]
MSRALLKHTSSIFFLTSLTLSIVVIPLQGIAMKTTLTPRISLGSQYEDTSGQYTPQDDDFDWSTTFSPGLLLELESPKTHASIDYNLELPRYHYNSYRNSTRHQAASVWEQNLGRHFRLELRDTYRESEEPLYESQVAESLREHYIYNRNNGEVNFSYLFGAEDSLGFGYRNDYLYSDTASSEDSLRHEGFLNLDTWFTRQCGISVASSVTRGKFKEPQTSSWNESMDNFYHYEGALTLNYRWGPSHRLFTRYEFLYQDFDKNDWTINTDDYRVHQGALGLELALSPNTIITTEGGHFEKDILTGGKKKGSTFSAAITTRWERATFNIEGSGGYDEDYFSVDDLGASEYTQTEGSFNYLLTENINLSTSVRFREDKFFRGNNPSHRKDDLWYTMIGFSFSITRALTLTLNGSYTERESWDKSAKFKNKRAIIRLVWVLKRWLTLTIDNTYTETTDNTDDLRRNQISISLISAYPISF